MADDIVIDTAEGIEHFQFAALIARLRIETRTGMIMSRGASSLQIAQRCYGVTKKTKKGGLIQLEALYKEKYGKEYGADAVPSDGD